jgi:hypothetical protein
MYNCIAFSRDSHVGPPGTFTCITLKSEVPGLKYYKALFQLWDLFSLYILNKFDT